MDKESKAGEIGTYFEQFISKQVETGRFASDAEVLQAGLRLLEEQQMQFQLQKNELAQKQSDSATQLDETAREANEISQSVTEAMRALATAASEQTVPVIPATKGLLRSHIAAE